MQSIEAIEIEHSVLPLNISTDFQPCDGSFSKLKQLLSLHLQKHQIYQLLYRLTFQTY